MVLICTDEIHLVKFDTDRTKLNSAQMIMSICEFDRLQVMPKFMRAQDFNFKAKVPAVAV